MVWLVTTGMLLAALQGDGAIKTEARSVTTFTAVRAAGEMEVIITQAAAFRVEVTADRNVLAHVLTQVKDGTLVLSEDTELRPSRPVRVAVAMPRVDAVELSGAGSVAARAVRGDALQTVLSGAGRMDIDATVARWTMRVSGTGGLAATGRAEDVTATLSGAGSLDARGVEAQRAVVTVSGAGSATVAPKALLDATVSGVGSVRYAGRPADIRKKVSGIGTVGPL